MTDDLALWYCRSIASALVQGNEAEAIETLREAPTITAVDVDALMAELWAAMGALTVPRPNTDSVDQRSGGFPLPFTSTP